MSAGGEAEHPDFFLVEFPFPRAGAGAVADRADGAGDVGEGGGAARGHRREDPGRRDGHRGERHWRGDRYGEKDEHVRGKAGQDRIEVGRACCRPQSSGAAQLPNIRGGFPRTVALTFGVPQPIVRATVSARISCEP